MSNEVESAQVSDATEVTLLSSSAEIESHAGSCDEEMTLQLLKDAVQSLPHHVVKDLLSVGVCSRCVLRILGSEDRIYCHPLLPQSILRSILEEVAGFKSEGNFQLCSVCLGILQLSYCDDKETMVKMESPNDMASTIAELVKTEGHQIDGFSLEVSVPQLILENESSLLSGMKKINESELWFQERMLSKCVSVKDVLKFAITKPLETLLDVKSTSAGCFRIRLTYTHKRASDNSVERNQGFKRRRISTGNGLHNVYDKAVITSKVCSDYSTNETISVTGRSSNILQDQETFEHLRIPIDKVSEPCHLVYLCYRTHIYLCGRYLKYSRNVSQTRWIIDEERMGEASVEEIIGSNILPMCRGDNYKFHAAGREDIDVRMLGSGRPFLLEIQNSCQIPSEETIKEIESKINGLENKLVGVKKLKVVSSQGWTLMREGEAEKQKQYCALVWISRPLEDEDVQSISLLNDMQILQKTPIRVLHRRSPLERQKIIHWMKIERISGSPQYFLLHLCTQAGTYIKEFVHGDLGRTQPSIGSILGCRAEIMQLDVTDVKMDSF
ncbi:putative tRNA pseudouridine synthase Pus10-like isoform X2 [Hibiscus syriacus]|uniref:tRNA pseudouridine(55) synthase n=1 Tax=Hibiscus syriacus TaxID=106335 RepID=A0A6A2XH01_HIBSY|nr:tRNA pseudouridine synthase Pus10-like [Hibiscus syriacus]KAE8674778.1 putative tRNA pseudouridine synthase Pus10-like isoform X2 [Hibiscus syriacus]